MDLIDRDAAMNIFAVDLAEKDRQVSHHGFCIDAAMAIGSLPSAEKTGKWISVSERLPKINQQVLVSINDGSVFAGHRLIPDTLWEVDDWDNKKAWVYDPERYTDNIDDLPRCEDCAFETNPDGILMAVISMNYNPSQRGVVAWMPFPEPYKGQSNCGERESE